MQLPAPILTHSLGNLNLKLHSFPEWCWLISVGLVGTSFLAFYAILLSNGITLLIRLIKMLILTKSRAVTDVLSCYI